MLYSQSCEVEVDTKRGLEQASKHGNQGRRKCQESGSRASSAAGGDSKKRGWHSARRKELKYIQVWKMAGIFNSSCPFFLKKNTA